MQASVIRRCLTHPNRPQPPRSVKTHQRFPRLASRAFVLTLLVVAAAPATLNAQRRTTSAFSPVRSRGANAPVARATNQPAQGAANPRLLPDISLVGDLIADLSPDGSTQED